MTIQLTMNTLHRRHPQLNVMMRIPGGWRCSVPHVAATDQWVLEAYAAYFGSLGVAPAKAWATAQATVQQTYVHGYTNGLRECISRRAMEYASMWPQLIDTIGTHGRKKLPLVLLRGFDAAKVQQMYVPAQNLGRAGFDGAKELLAAMGRVAL